MELNQITALAREYVEEENPITPYRNHSERDWDIQIDADSAERVIRFLLRRFCLVEKSRVKDEYHEAKFACGNVDPCSETWATYQAQKSLLERLFPDLGKEVER